MDEAAGGSPSPTAALVPDRLRSLFTGLDLAAVRWVLVRPVASLTGPGDVDLVVHPEDEPAARRTVAAAGFTTVPHGDPAQLHAVEYDRSGGRFVWLDLRTDLTVGGSVVTASDLLGAAHRDHGVPSLPPDWLFWLLLLGDLLEAGTVPERHRSLLADLRTRAPVPPPPLAAIAARRGVDPQAVLVAIAADRWSDLDRPARRPPFSERGRGRLVQLRRLWTARGISVAAIGPDGAGKTSLVGALHESLPLPSTIVYMGLTGGRLPKADRLRVPGLVFVARVCLLWTRYAVSLGHRVAGRTVLFDRSLLDAHVPSGATLSRMASTSRRIQGRSCPRPQLVIVLDAPGTTLHERSGEYDPEVLEGWRQAYLRIAERLPQAVLLDATRPAAEVQADALALVWDRYAGRWR